MTTTNHTSPIGEGSAQVITIDRRDLFDFLRGGIKSALEAGNAGDGMVASWYWQEATDRTERVLGNLGVASRASDKPIGEDAANVAIGEREAFEWSDDDDCALGRVIDALERIEGGNTVVSDDRLLANPKPRKMTIRDAKELAALYLPTLRRIRKKLDGMSFRAALTAEKVAGQEPVTSYCPSRFGKQPHAFNHQKCGYCGIAAPQPAQPVAQTLALTDEQREAIEWAAGRAHVESLGKPIYGEEARRWRVLSDLFRFALHPAQPASSLAEGGERE